MLKSEKQNNILHRCQHQFYQYLIIWIDFSTISAQAKFLDVGIISKPLILNFEFIISQWYYSDCWLYNGDDDHDRLSS